MKKGESPVKCGGKLLVIDGGFSKASFLSWAARNKLIMSDSLGNPTRQKKIAGKNNRCVWLKLDADIDEDGFRQADDVELPFK